MDTYKKLKVIHEIVCDTLGLDFEETFTRVRGECAEARQLTWYIFKVIHNGNGTSSRELGEFFIHPKNPEGFDHATVLSGLKKIKNFIDVNNALSNEVRINDIFPALLEKCRFAITRLNSYTLIDKNLNIEYVDKSIEEITKLVTSGEYLIFQDHVKQVK